MSTDQALLQFLQRAINTGAKKIEVPAYLLSEATDAAVKEARALCRLSGVDIVVRG